MNPIPVNRPLLAGNEAKYLKECIETGWISSEGPFVKRFEEDFARAVSRKYAAAVANGTVALELAVRALNIGPGDEVILPSFTIISCAAAVIRNGATPVLVDSNQQTWNMDVTQIESKITKKTKAIMVVHTYGLPVDMDSVLAIAKKHGLFVIEDAAEAHGVMYKGLPCGSFGDISIFSFYANKLVTTGEGGMVLTNNSLLHERVLNFRNLCFGKENRFSHDELGWNFRITNLQAAVGVAQLEQMQKFVQIKKTIGALYLKKLEHLSDRIQLPLPRTSFAENGFWVFGFVLKNPEKSANELMRELQTKGIGSRPFFWPMHKQPVLNERGLFLHEQLPVSEFLGKNGLYLPSGTGLTEDEVALVSQALIDILT